MTVAMARGSESAYREFYEMYFDRLYRHGLVLASGVYVIVRGLDNFFEGLKTKSLLGRYVERQRETLKQFDEEIHHHAHTHHDGDED